MKAASLLVAAILSFSATFALAQPIESMEPPPVLEEEKMEGEIIYEVRPTNADSTGEIHEWPDGVTFNPRVARAQKAFSVYPTELYSGDNVVTVRMPGTGLKSVRLILPKGEERYLTVSGEGKVDDCGEEATLRITVNTASRDIRPSISVVTCDGDTLRRMLSNMTWRLDRVNFPAVAAGETVCRAFQIGLTGFGPDSRILDSVTIPFPNAIVRIPGTFPITITPNSVFRYQVCVTTADTGTYTFPVITWMRRAQPTEGLTTYAVADTAVIRVRPQAPRGSGSEARENPDNLLIIPIVPGDENTRNNAGSPAVEAIRSELENR